MAEELLEDLDEAPLAGELVEAPEDEKKPMADLRAKHLVEEFEAEQRARHAASKTRSSAFEMHQLGAQRLPAVDVDLDRRAVDQARSADDQDQVEPPEGGRVTTPTESGRSAGQHPRETQHPAGEKQAGENAENEPAG